MDEETNCNEVMDNKLTKQESWFLYKTLVNKIKSLEDDNRRLYDQQGCLHKILDNRKQMMEVLKIQKDPTATAKEAESNLETFPKNKVISFRTLPIHEKTRKVTFGSSIIPMSVHSPVIVGS